MLHKEVVLNSNFVVSQVNFEDEYITINIKDSYYKVPLYISGLNIYLPEFDYCLPGRGVGIGHPDYYDVDYDLVGKDARVILDKDFSRNGHYRVHSKKTGIIYTKQAKVYKRSDVKNLITQIIDEEFDGSQIQGTVTRAYVMEMRTGIILYYMTNETELMASRNCFLVVTDPITYCEITLPKNLWRLKQ